MIFFEYNEDDDSSELENIILEYISKIDELTAFFIKKGVKKTIKNDDGLTAAGFVQEFIREFANPSIEFSILAMFGYENRTTLNIDFINKIKQKLLKIYKQLK